MMSTGMSATFGIDATASRLEESIRQEPNVAAKRQRWAGGHNRIAVELFELIIDPT